MEKKNIIKMLAVILISILFIYSGFHKIFDFNDTTLDFHDKLNNGILGNIFTYRISQGIIILAIFLLLLAPSLMIIGINNNNSLLKNIGAWALVVFTTLATIIYHPITNSKQTDNMLKNFAIIGGLLMIIINE